MYSHFNLVLQGFVFVMSYYFILCFSYVPPYSWGGLLFQKKCLGSSILFSFTTFNGRYRWLLATNKTTCSLIVMRLSVN